MDQINPTVVLITFSFIWLIKQLTCHCILEVKTKLLQSFFRGGGETHVRLACSHCAEFSLIIIEGICSAVLHKVTPVLHKLDSKKGKLT